MPQEDGFSFSILSVCVCLPSLEFHRRAAALPSLYRLFYISCSLERANSMSLLFLRPFQRPHYISIPTEVHLCAVQ